MEVGTWTRGLSNFEFAKPEEDEDDEDNVKEANSGLPPNLEAAKKLIQTVNKKTGYNVYDHIAKILIYLLDHRPINTVDIVENVSLEVSQRQYQPTEDEILQANDSQIEIANAELNKELIVSAKELEATSEEPEEVGLNRDLIESAFYFRQLEVGLDSSVIIRIVLSIKKLVAEKGLTKARFWGKINGLEQDYYIVEADYVEDADEEEEEEEQKQEEQAEEEKNETQEDEESEEPLPKIKYKPPKPVPREEPGEGANKTVYYVCNDPARAWIRLPLVTPQQIYVAKRIKKFFTGRLDAPIVSNPPFPGLEKNYLRAQLSRITAATLIAPAGLYEPDESAEDDDGVIASFVPAEEPHEPLIAAMAEPSGWVHIGQYILPQGRCKYWDPAGEEEEEEEESDEKDFSNPRKAKPAPASNLRPAVLCPLSDDTTVYGNEPWCIEITSPLMPHHSIVGVHSLLWPGSHTYAIKKKFDNIYIGWGQKRHPLGYSPHSLFHLAKEYPEIPEIREILDPSGEDDLAAKLASEKGSQEGDDDQSESDNENPDDDEED